MSNHDAVTPRLLTYKQASEYLAICDRTLWGLAKKGEIVAIRFGKATRFAKDELDRYVESKISKAKQSA